MKGAAGVKGKQARLIRFFHQSHNTVLFGGLFTLKQWIISSLKHDTVPRVNKLYCFYVKNPPKRIALWDRENSQLLEIPAENTFICAQLTAVADVLKSCGTFHR